MHINIALSLWLFYYSKKAILIDLKHKNIDLNNAKQQQQIMHHLMDNWNHMFLRAMNPLLGNGDR